MYEEYEDKGYSLLTRGIIKLYAKLIATWRPEFLEWDDPKRMNFDENFKESSSEESTLRRRNRDSETRVCTRRMKREERQKRQNGSSCGSLDSSYHGSPTPLQQRSGNDGSNDNRFKKTWQSTCVDDNKGYMSMSTVGIESLFYGSNFDIVMSVEGARTKKAVTKSRLKSITRFKRLIDGAPEMEDVYRPVLSYNLDMIEENDGKLAPIEMELLVKELESARHGAIGVKARSYLLNRLRGAVWWNLTAIDYLGGPDKTTVYSESADMTKEKRSALFVPPLPVSFYCEPTIDGRNGEIAGPVKELDEMTEWKLRCYADTEIGSWEGEGLLVPFSTAPRLCVNELKPDIIGSKRIVNRGWIAPEMLDLYESVERQDPDGLNGVITTAYKNLKSPIDFVI